MPRVVFMCGPAGSGKSTIARQFEEQGMSRLSFDQEAWARGLHAMPLAEEDQAVIDGVLRSKLVALLGQGHDVVLDFSFWSRRMREEWRALVAPFGVIPEMFYLATDRTTCLARVAARRHAHGDDFALPPDVAAAYFDHFEAPTADEGPLTVITSDRTP